MKSETTEVIRKLQCVLTPDEKLAIATEWSGVRSEQAETENALDSLKKEFNAKIAAHAARHR